VFCLRLGVFDKKIIQTTDDWHNCTDQSPWKETNQIGLKKNQCNDEDNQTFMGTTRARPRHKSMDVVSFIKYPKNTA
jgi:hypothetical protein